MSATSDRPEAETAVTGGNNPVEKEGVSNRVKQDDAQFH